MDRNASGAINISNRFAITFGICCITLYAMAGWLPESLFEESLNRHTISIAASFLGLCGYHPVLDGITLSQDGFSVRVITECSVLNMGVLFFSFVVAYPATLRKKLIGLALGIPVLHTGNILRIALVFAIGVKNRLLFEFVHVYVGQVLMVFFVIIVCLTWARATLAVTPPRKPLFFAIRFVAFSSIPFIAWLVFNREYVRLTDHVVRWLFSLFDEQLIIPYQHVIYYQTFNLVTFTGLVLASRIQMAQRKFLLLAAGLVSIVGMHILFRACNVLMTAFQNETAARLSVQVSLAGQYLVPVLLWLLMLRGEAEENSQVS